MQQLPYFIEDLYILLPSMRPFRNIFHVVCAIMICFKYLRSARTIIRCLSGVIAPATITGIRMQGGVGSFYCPIGVELPPKPYPYQRLGSSTPLKRDGSRISMKPDKIHSHFRQLRDYGFIIVFIPPVRPFREIMKRQDPS